MSCLKDDALLSPDEEGRAHIASCDRCLDAHMRVSRALSLLKAPELPSPFDSRRMARDFEAALDVEVDKRRRAWSPQWVAAVAVFAAFSGAAVAYNFLSADDEQLPQDVPAEVSSARSTAVDLVVEPETEPAVEEPVPAKVLVKKRRSKARKSATKSEPVFTPPPACDPAWVALGAERKVRGDGEGALSAYVAGLCGGAARRAADGVQSLVRGGRVEADIALEAIAKTEKTFQGERVSCVLGLRYVADATSVDGCERFFEAHPNHPATRDLSLAAAIVAERSGLSERALELYERGASAPARLRRAELLFKMGQKDKASQELKQYLTQRPDAVQRPKVRSLAIDLGLLIE